MFGFNAIGDLLCACSLFVGDMSYDIVGYFLSLCFPLPTLPIFTLSISASICFCFNDLAEISTSLTSTFLWLVWYFSALFYWFFSLYFSTFPLSLSNTHTLSLPLVFFVLFFTSHILTFSTSISIFLLLRY